MKKDLFDNGHKSDLEYDGNLDISDIIKEFDETNDRMEKQIKESVPFKKGK